MNLSPATIIQTAACPACAAYRGEPCVWARRVHPTPSGVHPARCDAATIKITAALADICAPAELTSAPQPTTTENVD